MKNKLCSLFCLLLCGILLLSACVVTPSDPTKSDAQESSAQEPSGKEKSDPQPSSGEEKQDPQPSSGEEQPTPQESSGEEQPEPQPSSGEEQPTEPKTEPKTEPEPKTDPEQPGEQKTSSDTAALNIGSQRQVFWDDYIVDTALTDAVLTLNHPTQKEIVYVTDAAWEGNSCDYYSLITVQNDDGTQYYRMYYNGWDTNRYTGTGDIVICAIESKDGVHWTRPDYGLISYNGSKHNNIVMKTAAGFDNFFVFVDTNPNCPANEKYKAVSEYLEPSSYGTLHGYTSPDGLHWTHMGLLRDNSGGATFDSVNTCFYDNDKGLYYLFYRGFHNGVRDIRVSTAASFDQLFLSYPMTLKYTDKYDFALYTNNIMPYYRAPQVYIGLPTRYNDHDNVWMKNMEYLPDRDERAARFGSNPRYASTVTDTLFMTSRDGYTFSRFTSAWYTPGAEHSGNWIYGDGYFAYGMVETPTEFADQDKELSLYTFEGKFKNDPSRLYRYTIRVDGFACYKAPSYDESVLTTKIFTFEGKKLLLNFATSGAGSIVVDILDENGNPITGYTSYTLFGDKVDRNVTFSKLISALEGKKVRLRFTMRDAEIYSFKFEK